MTRPSILLRVNNRLCCFLNATVRSEFFLTCREAAHCLLVLLLLITVGRLEST